MNGVSFGGQSSTKKTHADTSSILRNSLQKKNSGANFPLLLSPDKLAPVPLARRPRNSLQFEILELGAALAKAARPT